MKTSVRLFSSDFGESHVIPVAAPMDHPIVATSFGDGRVFLEIDDSQKARQFADAVLRACDQMDRKPAAMPPRSLAPYAVPLGGVVGW